MYKKNIYAMYSNKIVSLSVLGVINICFIFILLVFYKTDIFINYNLIYHPDKMQSDIPCYENGMTAFHEVIASSHVRSDGLMRPKLTKRKEREALRLLLADIEAHGMNTDTCTFFVVGPVYGLYESLGEWEEAQEFLHSALKYYSDTSEEYIYILGMLDIVNDEINRGALQKNIYHS